jgi:hypothetical protein
MNWQASDFAGDIPQGNVHGTDRAGVDIPIGTPSAADDLDRVAVLHHVVTANPLAGVAG